MFDYDSFTSRNIGFITPDEQLSLKKAKVFIPGVGGMGGVAITCLARAGVENFTIADFDEFEVSNLNRQAFATLNSLGKDKAKTTSENLKLINPNIQVQIKGKEWVEELDHILPNINFVINGCDDTLATIQLMRAAKKYNITVIDAFASTLPNVYVVKPGDPRPEKTFNFPSQNKDIQNINSDDVQLCAQKEVEYVLTHSNTAKHVVLEVAAEMVTGERSRISFSPMVWMTGCLMAYEAVKVILKKPNQLADYRGVFINPWTFKVERPHCFIVGKIKSYFVRRFINGLLKDKSLDLRKINA
ncbi:MAG: ThiF family adenylyltransferase [Bdellovibrionales bacterium]|nr:ThiF family adenylyltransferase [Bdellovibrionales bacterium]